MSIIGKYIMKNSKIEAVRVNRVELAKIREWCSGVVRDAGVEEDPWGLSIVVDVVRTKYHRGRKTTDRAFHGDWIVKDDEGFKIYTHEAFTSVYSPVVKDEEKYHQILRLVRESAVAYQHYDEDVANLIAKNKAQDILDLF